MRSRTIALLGAAALVLAGCGAGDDEPAADLGPDEDAAQTEVDTEDASDVDDEAAAEPPADATTITFWNAFTADDRPVVEALVERFNNDQDEVFVDMSIMPNDVLMQTLPSAYAAGEGPTVAVLDASQLPAFASQGVFQPVDDAYDGLLDADTLPQASLEATMWEGEQYGVPFSSAATMLYYNREIFEDAGLPGPPTSMEELADYAVQLTQGEQYGFAIPDHAAPSTWAVLLWSEGGGIVADDLSRSTFGDDATIEAVSFWNERIREDGISPIGLSGVDGDSLFGSGRAAMLINGPWASGGFEEAGVDFGIAPIPPGSEAPASVAISVNMHLATAADEDEKAAAYRFFEFWNSQESQIEWASGTGYPPNRGDVDPATLEGSETAATFMEAEGARFYLGGLVSYAEVDNDVVIPTIQRITNGEGTPEELLPAAADQIDALLR